MLRITAGLHKVKLKIIHDFEDIFKDGGWIDLE
jgi:hypothetical protein